MSDKKEQIQWWTYLVKNINYDHARSWHSEIKRTKGPEEADLFKRRVNYINGRKIL